MAAVHGIEWRGVFLTPKGESQCVTWRIYADSSKPAIVEYANGAGGWLDNPPYARSHVDFKQGDTFFNHYTGQREPRPTISAALYHMSVVPAQGDDANVFIATCVPAPDNPREELRHDTVALRHTGHDSTSGRDMVQVLAVMLDDASSEPVVTDHVLYELRSDGAIICSCCVIL